MNTDTLYTRCCAALFLGNTLQICDVSVGRGFVIDWRTVRSGETLATGLDALDMADMLLALVGREAVAVTLDRA